MDSKNVPLKRKVAISIAIDGLKHAGNESLSYLSVSELMELQVLLAAQICKTHDSELAKSKTAELAKTKCWHKGDKHCMDTHTDYGMKRLTICSFCKSTTEVEHFYFDENGKPTWEMEKSICTHKGHHAYEDTDEDYGIKRVWFCRKCKMELWDEYIYHESSGYPW